MASLVIKLRYTCGLSYADTPTVLIAWRNWGPTKNLAPSPIVFADAEQVVSRTITVRVPLETMPAALRGDAVLPADATVMLEVLAPVSNGDHDHVRARGGMCSITMRALLDKRRHFAVEYFNDFNDKGERTECGWIDIDETSLEGCAPAPASRVVLADATLFSFVDANAKFLGETITCPVARRIVNYTEEASGKGLGMTPLRLLLARVQAPWYTTTAGVTYGPLYWVAPVLSSNNAVYFRGVLRDALWRHNRDEAWMRATVSNQFERIKRDPLYFDDAFNECVRIVGDALCMPSVSLPYIGDTVDTNNRQKQQQQQQQQQGATKGGGGGAAAAPSKLAERAATKRFDPKLVKSAESWDDAALRKGGDCEDLARLIHMMFQGLRAGTWQPDTLEHAAARLLSLFVGCGTLGSVLAPALGNEHGDASPAKRADGPAIIDSPADVAANMGAHMWYEMHPRGKFVDALARTTDALPPTLAGTHTEPGWRNLISCILEGTGRLDPFQLPVAALLASGTRQARQALVDRETRRRVAVRHLLERAPITSIMQMTRSQRQMTRVPNARIGEFYMQSTTCVTLELAEQLNTLEFMWCTVGKRQPEPANADPLCVDTQPPASAPLPVTASCVSDWDAVTSALENIDEPALGAALSATPTLLRPTATRNTAHADRFMHSHAPLPAAQGVSTTVLTNHRNEAIRYGVEVEDKIRKQTPSHVGLLPTTSLDSIEARVGAETLRNLRPPTLPGNFAQLDAIFAAEDVALLALGIDRPAAERAGDAAVASLREWARVEMASDAWPTHAAAERANLSLVTFFFAKKELQPNSEAHTASTLESIKSQYGALKRAGAIHSARINVETPLPRCAIVALQFYCDSDKMK